LYFKISISAPQPLWGQWNPESGWKFDWSWIWPESAELAGCRTCRSQSQNLVHPW